MANPTVSIAGVDRTGQTRVNTVVRRRSMNDRGRLTCDLVETAGTYRPIVGNQIIVWQDGTKLFGGYIESLEEQAVPGTTQAISYSAEATDFTRLLDWRLYEGSFQNQSFYDIVKTIRDGKLTELTLTGVQNPGVTITERIQDGLRPVTEWFRKLSTTTGYFFRVDEDFDLIFAPLTTNPAPFSLTWSSGNWRNLHISRRIADYRNRQYVRTEFTLSGELTKNFTGDGSTREWFQFEGPFEGKPTVTLDTGGGPVAQTVGYFGWDLTGYDFYIDKEGWGLHRYPSQSAPPAGSTIAMTYRVRFDNKTVKQDAAEIAARAAIQGGTGVIEALHEDRYIDNKTALDNRATNLLRQHGEIPSDIAFETDSFIEAQSNSLKPGHRISINLTAGPSDVNGTFLVTEIESRWTVAKPSDLWVHSVRCTSLEPIGYDATPLERLQEAVRIGPDQSTIATESPDPIGGIIAQTLTTNTTISDPALPDGAEVEYHLTQDSTGGWVVSWNSNFKGVDTLTVPGDAGTTTVVRFRKIGGSYAMLFNSGGMTL